MAVSTIKEGFSYKSLVVSDAVAVVESALAKGGFVDGTKTITKVGYFPLGVVSINVSGTGSAVCLPRSVSVTDFDEGTITIYGGMRNVGTTDATMARLSVRILWIKM